MDEPVAHKDRVQIRIRPDHADALDGLRHPLRRTMLGGRVPSRTAVMDAALELGIEALRERAAKRGERP